MATIMAAMATIFKSHLSLSHSSGQKSSKYQFSLKLQHFEILMCFGRHLKNGHHSHNFFQILPNFELKLEIPNIMLVCKFEIIWLTNTNLRALTTYLGRTDERTNKRPTFPYPPLCFAGTGDKNHCLKGTSILKITVYIGHLYIKNHCLYRASLY